MRKAINNIRVLCELTYVLTVMVVPIKASVFLLIPFIPWHGILIVFVQINIVNKRSKKLKKVRSKLGEGGEIIFG